MIVLTIVINKIRLDFQKYSANALLTGIAIKISGPMGMRIIQFLRGELIACALAGAQKLEMSKELLAVDSNMIDQALDEIAILLLRPDQPVENEEGTEHEYETSKDLGRCISY